MSKSNAFETELLELLFNATPIANIADDASSSPATDIEVSLHTGDPGEAGDMSTSEATYTGYTRILVARTSGGWTITGNSVSPVSAIEFPQASAGLETITHIGFGSGVGDDLKYSGAVTPNIAINPGVTPKITTASTITED